MSDGVVAEMGDSSGFVDGGATASTSVVDGDAAGVIVKGIGGVVGINGFDELVFGVVD
ncbi:hypothetical protein [Baaleninema sp.]|uniref:hypothetical protein n=1 Tax=Baaleninema sp. TaxID=3101197 RepID=UPI003D07202D